MAEKYRVRFAPSPTGSLHIGGAHTALFNWLLARRTGGTFVLRIEDTDIERSTKEYERSILDGMRWMGLDWDEGPDRGGDFGPYRQSERMHLYKKYARQLLDEGKAYEKEGAIFFRIEPGKHIHFHDEVYGDIDVESERASVNQDGTIKDIVIMKRDGMPTYNYAVVIDDFTMGINMVIRGEDHVINTPKQLLVYDALGFRRPHFAHLPMILGRDKKKLSKRQGATSVFEYSDMGYLPDGVFNFLALLGWSPRTGQEIFTREEAVEIFDIKNVTRKPAVFDVDKLNHINQEQMKMMEPHRLLEAIRPFWEQMGLPVEKFDDEYLAASLKTLGGRGQTTIEVAEYSDYFLDFSKVTERYDGKEIKEELRPKLKKIYGELLDAWGDGTPERLHDKAQQIFDAHGSSMKESATPMRWALTGRKVSPGVFEVAAQLGKEETKIRLEFYGLV
ncbi:MAG: glutamate--tRNA ligase family protein [Synergistes jonesii]|uniref:glutamate--tRNA ligase n=1 Tax=Synergistes jonesii TaxID=2754 RepID=UPI002A766812|nr:glutamate--tRNA ligase family protein [Synergistes jonesii]MDY2984279.1 glutamate--tRNA ligase family protein [Synergistes jonesii]